MTRATSPIRVTVNSADAVRERYDVTISCLDCGGEERETVYGFLKEELEAMEEAHLDVCPAKDDAE